MSDTFWIKFWLITGSVIIVFIGAVTFYQYNKNELIVKMVSAGASPTEAAIAMGNTYGETARLYLYQNKCKGN